MGLLKIILLILLIAVFSVLSRSSVRASEDLPPIEIQQIDPNFDSQKLAGPGVKVHSASELKKGGWKLPDAAKRDALFEKAEMGNDVKGWDALDRDLLFVSAQNSTANVLVKTYPKIPKEHLLKLSNLVKNTPSVSEGK